MEIVVLEILWRFPLRREGKERERENWKRRERKRRGECVAELYFQ